MWQAQGLPDASPRQAFHTLIQPKCLELPSKIITRTSTLYNISGLPDTKGHSSIHYSVDALNFHYGGRSAGEGG